ncbi:hypothetical protein AGDE_08557 [Angomonas deanei]|nr:hypothetical protein AGDE_08557 [Angomonas deanei]|eukprot:EPY32576.1 hypothetical protein AGDE_08557 [Angomonas deanei]
MGVYVFEAKKMPFDTISEEFAKPAFAILSNGETVEESTLRERHTLYERCLLVAVWAVLQEQNPKPSIDLALKIVGQLDELDEAFDRSKEARGDADYAALNTNNGLTAEEQLMNALFQERFGHDFLPVDDAVATSNEIDIAMCFDESGSSIGLGTAKVFGTHGYHK